MNKLYILRHISSIHSLFSTADVHKGFNWHKRYQIILGICEGLNYLHTIPGSRNYHLNLNLDNVFLDMDMVPKITDFGLSTLFREESISFEGAW
jgi:serine/threonine protein kinase